MKKGFSLIELIISIVIISIAALSIAFLYQQALTGSLEVREYGTLKGLDEHPLPQARRALGLPGIRTMSTMTHAERGHTEWGQVYRACCPEVGGVEVGGVGRWCQGSVVSGLYCLLFEVGATPYGIVEAAQVCCPATRDWAWRRRGR